MMYSAGEGKLRPERRFPEVDILRGTAIVLMIIYHTFFDLDYLGSFDFQINGGILLVIGRSAAILFIFTAGLSLTLSSSRHRLETGKEKPFMEFLKRGGRIFGWGLLITVVTWLVVPQAVIIFGILHFLGVSIVLGYFFLNYKITNLVLAGIIAFLGIIFREIALPTDFLLWLGLHSPDFTTLDYFPLFPWFSVFLMGIATGNFLYGNYERKFSLPFRRLFSPQTLPGRLGRNSLGTYLLHQPVLIGLLYFSGLVELPF
jgi:uncharacterized membrane protein